MKVYDPIYGAFSTPRYLDGLLAAPEVRRLSEIRLLNTLTPSLATLGELRRFSHTLGVVFLCLQNPHLNLSEDEIKALLASVLIHDSGTPPFAHLFEYYLAEKYHWNHENVIGNLISGSLAPENTAHQIYRGMQIRFKKICHDNKIDFDLVLRIVRKQDPLSLYIFGGLDLDNLDNVVRMAWALGISSEPQNALTLASQLGARQDRRMVLSKLYKRNVETWARTRRQVYDVIVFDQPTVAAQAVLTQAIGITIDAGLITEHDWTLSDEAFLKKLERIPEAKRILMSEYFGRLPACLFFVQVEGTLDKLGFESRDGAVARVQDFARRQLGASDTVGYVFVDRGTFEKSLEFVDPDTEETWATGRRSESVIFYCFVRGRRGLKPEEAGAAANAFAEELGARPMHRSGQVG